MVRNTRKSVKSEIKNNVSGINAKKGGTVVKKQPEKGPKRKVNNKPKCPKCSVLIFNLNRSNTALCISCLKNETMSHKKSVGKVKPQTVASTEVKGSPRKSNRKSSLDSKSKDIVPKPTTKSNPTSSSPSSKCVLSPRGVKSQPNPISKRKTNTREQFDNKKFAYSTNGQSSSMSTKSNKKEPVVLSSRKSANKMSLRGTKRSYAQLASGTKLEDEKQQKRLKTTPSKELALRVPRSKKPTVKGSEWLNTIHSKKTTSIKQEKSKKETLKKTSLKLKSESSNKAKKNVSSKGALTNAARIIKSDLNKKPTEKHQVSNRRSNRRSSDTVKEKEVEKPMLSKTKSKKTTGRLTASPKGIQKSKNVSTKESDKKTQGTQPSKKLFQRKKSVKNYNFTKSSEKTVTPCFMNKNKSSISGLKENVLVVQEILQDILNSVGSSDSLSTICTNISKPEGNEIDNLSKPGSSEGSHTFTIKTKTFSSDVDKTVEVHVSQPAEEFKVTENQQKDGESTSVDVQKHLSCNELHGTDLGSSIHNNSSEYRQTVSSPQLENENSVVTSVQEIKDKSLNIVTTKLSEILGNDSSIINQNTCETKVTEPKDENRNDDLKERTETILVGTLKSPESDNNLIQSKQNLDISDAENPDKNTPVSINEEQLHHIKPDRFVTLNPVHSTATSTSNNTSLEETIVDTVAEDNSHVSNVAFAKENTRNKVTSQMFSIKEDSALSTPFPPDSNDNNEKTALVESVTIIATADSPDSCQDKESNIFTHKNDLGSAITNGIPIKQYNISNPQEENDRPIYQSTFKECFILKNDTSVDETITNTMNSGTTSKKNECIIPKAETLNQIKTSQEDNMCGKEISSYALLVDSKPSDDSNENKISMKEVMDCKENTVDNQNEILKNIVTFEESSIIKNDISSAEEDLTNTMNSETTIENNECIIPNEDNLNNIKTSQENDMCSKDILSCALLKDSKPIDDNEPNDNEICVKEIIGCKENTTKKQNEIEKNINIISSNIENIENIHSEKHAETFCDNQTINITKENIVDITLSDEHIGKQKCVTSISTLCVNENINKIIPNEEHTKSDVGFKELNHTEETVGLESNCAKDELKLENTLPIECDVQSTLLKDGKYATENNRNISSEESVENTTVCPETASTTENMETISSLCENQTQNKSTLSILPQDINTEQNGMKLISKEMLSCQDISTSEETIIECTTRKSNQNTKTALVNNTVPVGNICAINTSGKQICPEEKHDTDEGAITCKINLNSEQQPSKLAIDNCCINDSSKILSSEGNLNNSLGCLQSTDGKEKEIMEVLNMNSEQDIEDKLESTTSILDQNITNDNSIKIISSEETAEEKEDVEVITLSCESIVKEDIEVCNSSTRFNCTSENRIITPLEDNTTIDSECQNFISKEKDSEEFLDLNHIQVIKEGQPTQNVILSQEKICLESNDLRDHEHVDTLIVGKEGDISYQSNSSSSNKGVSPNEHYNETKLDCKTNEKCKLDIPICTSKLKDDNNIFETCENNSESQVGNIEAPKENINTDTGKFCQSESNKQNTLSFPEDQASESKTVNLPSEEDKIRYPNILQSGEDVSTKPININLDEKNEDSISNTLRQGQQSNLPLNSNEEKLFLQESIIKCENSSVVSGSNEVVSNNSNNVNNTNSVITVSDNIIPNLESDKSAHKLTLSSGICEDSSTNQSNTNTLKNVECNITSQVEKNLVREENEKVVENDLKHICNLKAETKRKSEIEHGQDIPLEMIKQQMAVNQEDSTPSTEEAVCDNEAFTEISKSNIDSPKSSSKVIDPCLSNSNCRNVNDLHHTKDKIQSNCSGITNNCLPRDEDITVNDQCQDNLVHVDHSSKSVCKGDLDGHLTLTVNKEIVDSELGIPTNINFEPSDNFSSKIEDIPQDSMNVDDTDAESMICDSESHSSNRMSVEENIAMDLDPEDTTANVDTCQTFEAKVSSEINMEIS